MKITRLTYEATPPVHALFVKESAKNRWSISSKPLRELVEHFGPGAEQLDIFSADGRVHFNSFTEKVVSHNQEVLKQPLHTTVALDALEFRDFFVEDGLHVVIGVKDFKSIISHAGLTSTMMKAAYSYPASPMQLTYGDDNMLAEYILMTVNESRSNNPPPQRTMARRVKETASNEPTTASARSTASRARSTAASGTIRHSTFGSGSHSEAARPSSTAPPAESQLFFPDANDDRRWDPVDFDDEEEPNLLWDAGVSIARGRRTFC